jgi:hypothetical protein
MAKMTELQVGDMIDVGPPVRVVRVLLPFEPDGPGGSFLAKPQMPFRPDGLAIWGAELAQASVTKIFNGNTIEGVAALGPVPAQFFALKPGQGYQELAELVEAGEPPKSWIDFGTCRHGCYLQIEVTRAGKVLGPADGIEIAMWGRSLR